jgi:hypothetical protein
MSGPRETIYDEQISPLMTQIIAICKENKIPVVASFELDIEEGHPPNDPLMCTTSLLFEGEVHSKSLPKMHAAAYPPHPPVLMVTTTKADGSKIIEAILP